VATALQVSAAAAADVQVVSGVGRGDGGRCPTPCAGGCGGGGRPSEAAAAAGAASWHAAACAQSAVTARSIVISMPFRLVIDIEGEPNSFETSGLTLCDNLN
jgi:hypothetical protein